MTDNGYAGSHRRPSKPGRKQVRADMIQLSVYVPRDLADAARNAVIATTAYPGGYRRLSALVADALAAKVTSLQDQFNDGAPFPQRADALPRGRPRSSRRRCVLTRCIAGRKPSEIASSKIKVSPCRCPDCALRSNAAGQPRDLCARRA